MRVNYAGWPDPDGDVSAPDIPQGMVSPNWNGAAWIEKQPSAVERAIMMTNTRAQLSAAVQAHLDATAQADRWDSIYTAAMRAGYPGPYQELGRKYATWMDACWVRVSQIEADVLAGVRPVPTADELIGLLPVFGTT